MVSVKAIKSDLIGLNEEQQEAINYGEGPLLIIAGAGTGKTTVVTERIKNLILEKNVHPSEILALTFTEKAAREMEERVDIAMPYGYTQMWISTFHAFCDRILRNEAINIGLNPSYKLTTESEAILFLRINLFKFNLNYFRPLGNPNKFLQGILQHFSRLKDEDVSPDEYVRWAQNQKSSIRQAQDKNQKEKNEEDESEEIEIRKNLELANAYQTYENLKAKEGIMDFSDLISNVLKLFRTRKNILKNYQQQFKYVLVDEFQDTNFAQNEMAILLAGDRKNITVAGDDDQSIYRFRGAAISNIIQFRKYFPDAKIVVLSKNYRSTQEILDRSYNLIQNNNPDRLEVQEKINKRLTSMRKIKGKKIEILFAERVENEADLVIEKIKEMILTDEPKYKFMDIAILVRANDHAQPFVRALERAQIPFQFLGPGRLFHQEEIKDLISYLKVLYNFEDSTALYRILNLPIFELNSRDIASILIYGKKKNYYLFEALEKIDETFISDQSKEKIKDIVKMIKKHLERISKDTAGQILYYFLEDCGLLKHYLSAKSEREAQKSQNIAKFFDKLKSYEGENKDASVFAITDWLDLSMQLGESPLATDTDWSNNNAVNILTIHSSKGLEFPMVFLVNLVSQRFPTRERKEQIPIPQEIIKEILPTGDFHLQEERRLFYVGMTRARDYLFLTAANFYGEGKRERKISPFVYETLGEDIVNNLTMKQSENRTASDAVKQLSLLEWATDKKNEILKQEVLTGGNSVPQALTPINYISYSQIQTFDFCPLHYKLRYILKIPVPQTAAQSFGTSIHAALRN
ncbi:MAG: ATP-dependent DNA helicase, partial [Candidatus Levybacteria bacterium]|nr:ATP-dependent DNA helicase [Candidatus Levybacteria bacterium]